MKKFRKTNPKPRPKPHPVNKRELDLDLRKVPPEVMTKAALAMIADGKATPGMIPDMRAAVRKEAPQPLFIGCSDEQGFLGMIGIKEYPFADETQFIICVNDEWVPSARSAAQLQRSLDPIYTSLSKDNTRVIVDFHVDFRSYFNYAKYNPTIKSRCEADEHGQMSMALYSHEVYHGSVAIKWLPDTNEVMVSLQEYPGFSRGFTVTEQSAPRLKDLFDEIRSDFGDVAIILTITKENRLVMPPERPDHEAAWRLSMEQRGIPLEPA